MSRISKGIGKRKEKEFNVDRHVWFLSLSLLRFSSVSPCVFVLLNNSKDVKVKFIEFVSLKAFFQVVHFICSMNPSLNSLFRLLKH